MNELTQMLSNIPMSTWYIIFGVAAAIIIVSLVMKAIKLAIAVAIIAIAFTFFASPESLPEQYGINYSNGVISILADGETTTINTKDLENLRVEEGEGNQFFVRYTFKGEDKEISIPKVLVKAAKDKVEDIKDELEAQKENK